MNKKQYRIRMIATATQSHPARNMTGRHDPMIYALLTDQMNVNEPGDDVIMVYDQDAGEWLALPDPRDYLEG